MQRKPLLSEANIQARIAFAKKHMSWTNEWNNVLFSDEKRFCLDGPDCYNYYFHDIRTPEPTQIRRQQGGGGIMVWGIISSFGKWKFEFVAGSLTGEKYKELLNNKFLPFYKQLRRKKLIFQQDNAPAHTSRIVKSWFEANKIKIMEWPAKSPDLNIIENCWAELSRTVYGQGRQYLSLNELQIAIEEASHQLNPNYIKNLYNSLPKRIFETIKNKGKSTHY